MSGYISNFNVDFLSILESTMFTRRSGIMANISFIASYIKSIPHYPMQASLWRGVIITTIQACAPSCCVDMPCLFYSHRIYQGIQLHSHAVTLAVPFGRFEDKDGDLTQDDGNNNKKHQTIMTTKWQTASETLLHHAWQHLRQTALQNYYTNDQYFYSIIKQ